MSQQQKTLQQSQLSTKTALSLAKAAASVASASQASSASHSGAAAAARQQPPKKTPDVNVKSSSSSTSVSVAPTSKPQLAAKPPLTIKNSQTQALYEKLLSQSTPQNKTKARESSQNVFASQLLPCFTNTLKQLLSALNECFPECENTKTLLNALEETQSIDPALLLHFQILYIQEWHIALADHYGEILENYIENALTKQATHPIFVHLNLHSKYTTLDDEAKATMIQYVNYLNAFACFFNEIPMCLLKTFERLSHEFLDNPDNLAEVSALQSGDNLETATANAVNKMLPQLPRIMDELNASLTDESAVAQIETFTEKIPLIISYVKQLPELKNVLKCNPLMQLLEI